MHEFRQRNPKKKLWQKILEHAHYSQRKHYILEFVLQYIYTNGSNIYQFVLTQCKLNIDPQPMTAHLQVPQWSWLRNWQDLVHVIFYRCTLTPELWAALGSLPYLNSLNIMQSDLLPDDSISRSYVPLPKHFPMLQCLFIQYPGFHLPSFIIEHRFVSALTHIDLTFGFLDFLHEEWCQFLLQAAVSLRKLSLKMKSDWVPAGFIHSIAPQIARLDSFKLGYHVSTDIQDLVTELMEGKTFKVILLEE
jgi:hypothetical protein